MVIKIDAVRYPLVSSNETPVCELKLKKLFPSF